MPPGTSGANRSKAAHELGPEHYLQLIFHRKGRIAAVFVVVAAATIGISHTLPNIYTSETLILVDPQKVPDNYVKATITGDVRNRLGTLTQQILSTTRLQKIIEAFGLYSEERKKLAREDVIALMRKDISTSMVVGGGTQQDLQAFRIIYNGKDPQLVAQVTNQLAAMFIEENLKARELQSTGTTEFLQHQLEENRKTLETQEGQLREFKLKHLGEMPEHQMANLTVLGQLQASLQQVSDALSRSEQQRTYLQTMMAQSTPVVDLDGGADENESKAPNTVAPKPPAPKSSGPAPNLLSDDKARLVALLSRYTETHPEVRKLRQQILEREAKGAATPGPVAVVAPGAEATLSVPPPPPAQKRTAPSAGVRSSTNPVLLSQLKAVEAEIGKYKEEQLRLNKLVGSYQVKLEAIPIREQQIAELVRDYEINKSHYAQLLDKQLSAEMATQLEIRQKGERFSILDPAQPAQRPSKPNRMLIDVAGLGAGLLLGILLALVSEFAGISILCAEQIPEANGNQVLEIIPIIVTEAGRQRKKKHMIIGAISGTAATVVSCGVLFHYFRG